MILGTETKKRQPTARNRRILSCRGIPFDGGEDRGSGKVEGHEDAPEGEYDRHPPGTGEPPADVRKFRPVDPTAEDLPIAPEADEDEQAPEEDGEIAGMHFS